MKITKRFICLLLGIVLTVCFGTGCSPIYDDGVTIENFTVNGDFFSCIVKIKVDCTELKKYGPENVTDFGIIMDDADNSDYLDVVFGDNFYVASYTDFLESNTDFVFTETDKAKEYLDTNTNIHNLDYESNDTDIEIEISGEIPSKLRGKNLIVRAFVIMYDRLPTAEASDNIILNLKPAEPVADTVTVIIGNHDGEEEEEETKTEINPETGAPVVISASVAALIGAVYAVSGKNRK